MQNNQNTFVSNYSNSINSVDIERYLNGKGLQLKPASGGTQLNSKECPFCPPHSNKSSNLWKLFFDTNTGGFFCHRCKRKGSFFDYQKEMGDLPDMTDAQGNSVYRKKIYKRPDQDYVSGFEAGLEFQADVDTYCKNRGIREETLRYYRVGAATYHYKVDNSDSWNPHLCVTFPWYDRDKEGKEYISRVKARSIADKGCMRLDPTGGAWGFFGWHTVHPDATQVVVTEGEWDAMVVYQETGVPAISLPNGSNSLPPELIKKLEQFKRIYLWLDDDAAGQSQIPVFVDKLGRERTFIVRSRGQDPKGPKDANEALKQGVSVRELLTSAKPTPHEQIITFKEIRNEIYRELLDQDALKGTPYNSMPKLTKIIGGHRRGEFDIITGGTGMGKTSVMSQLSLDQLILGVPTLWGSFEIKNHKLGKKMLNQFAKMDLAKCMQDFDKCADSFQRLSLYFMKFFGSTNVDAVLDAMRFAVYALDVQNFVLDNLQFMTQGQGSGYAKFDVQDETITKLRDFATSTHTKVTLVSHPRKGSKGSDGELGVDDIFGGGKASQDADNIYILQNLGNGQRAFDVVKNRELGTLGRVYYKFDQGSSRIIELTGEEMSGINVGGARKGDSYQRYNNFKNRQSKKQQGAPLKNYAPGADNGQMELVK